MERTKIAFIMPYPEDTAPGQRFRYEQYLDNLAQSNYSIIQLPFYGYSEWKYLYKKGHFAKKAYGVLKGFFKRIYHIYMLFDVEYVFLFREAAHIGPPIFEWIIARVLRKKIIYDFDDAIWLPNYSEHNKAFNKLKFYAKVKWIIGYSWKLSVGNKYLAEYASKYTDQEVVINPTTIDTENYHNQVKKHTQKEKVIIGWTGTLTTIKYLREMIPLFRELEKEYKFELRVIANEDPQFDLASATFIHWQKESEIEDLLEFDVGLMPLVEDKWSKGKCGFKALQYMALGIPALVSPVGVNTDIVDHGVNGYVCNSDTQWKSALVDILKSDELRQKMGYAARKKIENHYSVRSNTANFIGLFRG